MSRSKWKGPYVKLSILQNSDKNFQTDSRSSTILPNFIGKTFKIHNGLKYTKLVIKEDMVGYKLGEFSPTRQKFKFKKTKRGSKSKSKRS